MTITAALLSLETSEHPVAKALYKGNTFKVLTIVFKKNMILKEHKTTIPTKLIVIKGSIIYNESNSSKILTQYEEMLIPVNVIHSVECIEDAICLLIQG